MSAQPYYARRNPEGQYTWEGVKYKSVTTYLGYAPGSFLMTWYGKQAALKTASHLVQAGALVPPGDDDVLIDFCRGLVSRELTLDQAIKECGDWRRNMIDAERYRDHKARVGSLTHHLIYETAIGQTTITNPDTQLLDYLRESAIRLHLWDKEKDPDFTPTEEMIDSVVGAAYAYAMSALEWMASANPVWTMIGQEAVVVRKDHGDGIAYAGTVDGHLTLTEKEYRGEWHPAWPKNELSMYVDFKTSNALAHRSVQAQVEAYAHADIIGLVETGEEHPLPEADLVGALHIGPHASSLGVQDEFGTLESKTNQVGAKLYTYPRSEETFEAFCGLVRWADYSDGIPRAHQQRQTRTEPAVKRGKYEERTCPI